MPPELAALLQPFLQSSPVAALLLLAVWWLTKGNETLIRSLNQERKERIAILTSQVDKLEKRSEDCEKDRMNLHRLLSEVRNLSNS